MSDGENSPEKHRGLKPPWKPGQSGNPAGKPKGARNRLGEAFLEALASDFDQFGVAAIIAVRTERPHEYLKVVASILPKDINLKVDPLDDISDAELDQRLRQLASLIGIEIRAHAPLDGEGEAGDENQTSH